MNDIQNHLNEPVVKIAHKDFVALQDNLTIQEALELIRKEEFSDKIIYFYVINKEEQIVGVLPTRRLLTSPLNKKLSEIMIQRVVSIPENATIFEACESFVMHKFLAFPVIDEKQHIIGIVDISQFTDEVFDIVERQQLNTIFESIGLRLTQVKDASPLKAFKYRFKWLFATFLSGITCAYLSSMYETTLSKSIILAFFLTLVLGLGESVSMQSMTVTIHKLLTERPGFRWYIKAFFREIITAFMLGLSCGGVIGIIVWIWRGAGLAAVVIGSSVLLSICIACVLGLTIPSVLHKLKLDPKIAAGPVTLALADIFTVVIYFSIATFIL